MQLVACVEQEDLAANVSLEQGKTLADAKGDVFRGQGKVQPQEHHHLAMRAPAVQRQLTPLQSTAQPADTSLEPSDGITLKLLVWCVQRLSNLPAILQQS